MGEGEKGGYLVEVEVGDDDTVEVRGVQGEGVGVDSDEVRSWGLWVSASARGNLDVVQELGWEKWDECEGVVHWAEESH